MRPNELIERIAAANGLTVGDLRSARRRKDIARARHEAAWCLRRRAQLTLMQIGRLLGGRHHSTILHGLRQVEKWREDVTYARRLSEIAGLPVLPVAPLERSDPAVAEWLRECGL